MGERLTRAWRMRASGELTRRAEGLGVEREPDGIKGKRVEGREGQVTVPRLAR
jgi:hypothetical protein